jgi:bifunctional DNA-binding transcriptional regulator/antitoxin component of YhaV-PrlF toxin-antitoxin module
MTMTSVRVQAKGQVTIPKEIRDKLNAARRFGGVCGN